MPRESDNESEGAYDEDDDQSEEELKFGERPTPTTKKVGPSGLPLDVLKAAEPGLEGSDFRQKLRKAKDTKINTAAAFPEAKATAEQVDFRNILKKTPGVEKKGSRTGEEQAGFKTHLKKKVCLKMHTSVV